MGAGGARSEPQVNGVLWTGPGAVAAADAFRAVWRFNGVNAHVAGFGAQTAIHTGILIHAQAIQRRSVEQSVCSPQRTNIFAEWPINEDRDQNCYNEDRCLPLKQKSHHRL